MSQNLLGLQTALKRLGVTGRNQLPMEERIVPTAVVATVNPLIGEPFEARTVFGWRQPAAVGLYPAVEVQSNTRGGISIDNLVVRVEPNSGYTQMGVTSTPILWDHIGMSLGGSLIFLRNGLDTGGAPTTSSYAQGEFSIAHHPGPYSGVDRDRESFRGDMLELVELQPIYVKPGHYFWVIGDANTTLTVAGRWREIPELGGG